MNYAQHNYERQPRTTRERIERAMGAHALRAARRAARREANSKHNRRPS